MRAPSHAVTFAAALLLGQPGGSGADDTVARGSLLFQAVCATCHAGNQSTNADAVRIAAGRPEAIRAAIENVGAMNDLAGALSDDDLAAIAAWLASREAATRRNAIEYRHVGNGHYFVTADPGEIAALDARRGALEPWRRTSLGFAVDATPDDGRRPACRAYTAAYGGRATHFYSLDPAECDAVRRDPAWIDEGIAFHARAPVGGTCPAGTVALERLYNGGRGGAPNHRYVVDPVVRDAMLAEGFVLEGVAMCVPR